MWWSVCEKKSLDSYREWKINWDRSSIIDHSCLSVLSPKECQRIIDEGERMAARVGGWLSKRHKELQQPISHFTFWRAKRGVFGKWQQHFEKNVLGPILKRSQRPSLRSMIFGQICPQEQADLRLHRDGTVISFVLQLNEDFEEGGTYIHSLEDALVHKTGDLCVHSGWMLHGARAITKGVRYVLIGFCNIDAFWVNKEAKRPYYQYTEDKTVLRSVIKPEFL